MKKLLEDYIKLARDWRDFSREMNGWDCRSYRKGKVQCYFADTRDHSSVSFRFFEHDVVQISFHSSPTVSGFTLRSVDLIEKGLVEYSALLDELKAEYKERDAEEVEKEKQAKIEALNLQIAELKDSIK